MSCIIAVMDREKALQTMLPSWTRVEKIKDFVIVDWNSKIPIIENSMVRYQMAKFKNIKIIRVENQKYFYRCLAWNLAFQNTNPENKILLKLDADYYNKDSSWMDKLVLDEDKTLKNYFYASWEEPANKNLYGFLLVNKKHFGEGYNENFEAVWGAEDENLYLRIESSIQNKRKILKNPKTHICHLNHATKGNVKYVAKYKFDKKGRWINQLGWLNPETNQIDFYTDGVTGIPTRHHCQDFNSWEPAKYKILEDSSNYKRVELIEP
jgi:hypothetical protein